MTIPPRQVPTKSRQRSARALPRERASVQAPKDLPPPVQRGTRQKAAIRSVIEKSQNPLLPAEILKGAQASVAGLGLATIYRNLKALVEAGEVRAVELPGEPTRFESAELGHHHHFQCRVCAKVFDVHSCSGHFEDLAPQGFLVERHELTLYGLCSMCVKARDPLRSTRK